MNIAFIRKWLIAMQQGVFGSPGKWQKLTFQTTKKIFCARVKTESVYEIIRWLD